MANRDFIIENGVLIKYVGGGGEVVIPDGVSAIGDEAFILCAGLTSIAIPSSVTTIGERAFGGCKDLTSITFAEDSRLTGIGQDAFSFCTSLTSVSLPASVASIGERAFSRCGNLTSLTISDGMRIIGAEAFSYCKQLSALFLPDSVIEIGARAFAFCHALESVTVKGKLERLGESAFESCGALRHIDIPAPMNVEEHSFAGCHIVPNWGFAACKNQTVKENTILCWLTEDPRPNNPEYVKYLKKNKRSILFAIAENDNVDAFTAITRENIGGGFSIEDLDEEIGFIPRKPAVTAAMREYKSKTFTQEERNAYAEEKKKTAEGRGLTVAGWRKVFTLKKRSAGYEIVKYLGDAAMVCIPAVIGKTPVTSIGDKAFRYCKSTSITIPSSVKSIGEEAFDHCGNLTEITIPSSVTSIGSRVLAYCGRLTSVTVAAGNPCYHSEDNCLIETEKKRLIVGCSASVIPSSVTCIGEFAFAGAEDLTNVTIPFGVKRIEGNVFEHCDSLATISVPSSVESIDSFFDNCPSLVYNEYENGLYLGNAENPYLILIGFKDTSFTQCTINESTKFVYRSAFYGCDRLTSVTIPPSVAVIGAYAFDSCRNLTSVTISNGVTHIERNAFFWCHRLASITIPESVVEIEETAFKGCGSLETVLIKGKLQRIGWAVFSGCDALRRIEMPRPLRSSGDPFVQCPVVPSWQISTYRNQAVKDRSVLLRLSDEARPIESEYLDYMKRNKARLLLLIVEKEDADAFVWMVDASVGIRFGIEELDEAINAAAGTVALTAALLSYKRKTYSQRRLDAYAKDREEKAWGLKEYTLADWRKVFALKQTATGYEIVKYRGKAAAVFVPAVIAKSPVTRIGAGAFRDCNDLRSVSLPSSLESIGASAFENCIALESIAFAEGGLPMRIEDGAFRFCSGLTSISLPSNVTSIGRSAFSLCTALTSVTLSSSLTAIGDQAFARCESLTSVEIPSSVTYIGEKSFGECKSLTSIAIPPSVTSIGDQAFTQCESLTSVEIPSSVTHIGEWAFAQCRSLTSVEIPPSVRSIGMGTFRDCTELARVTLPEGLTTIPTLMFENCAALTEISIPLSVTNIGEAFPGCRKLRSLAIPSGVTYLGGWTVRECFALRSITFAGTVAEWRAIKKWRRWACGVPVAFVNCSDGDTPLEE